ncbi:nucleotidyltransferase domain-containing protein [Aureimonas glaciei]|jgi:predicted nucleotidyltransferase|uniref:Polymerase nucleotidyl transferase domain-containing protein n=1 Tax=Aureimonas glaciei TaxID=1776957 RepID=A0A917DAS6_9HYPH|nr:nucleotidyltransferase domain-containing protein [Aureimonas glaciei]GGD19689.1 hypothetical protein GCM10011335_23280 [Aureimonas glaciei]
MRERLIARVVAVLQEAWMPERIVLFGSSANPRAARPRDIDILVIAPTDIPRPLRRRIAEAPFAAFPVKVDVLVFTPHEARNALPASLVATALKHGRELLLR